MKKYFRPFFLFALCFIFLSVHLDRAFAESPPSPATPNLSTPSLEKPKETAAVVQPSTPPALDEKNLTPKQKEEVDVFRKAAQAATKGPAEVQLLDQGTLNLPEGYLFIPASEASDMMRIIGNTMGPELVGVIISRKDGLHWFITVEYDKLGYIKDDDAKNLNADELLNSIKDNTEKSNEDRIAKGFPPLSIEKWIRTPSYDPASHQLVWSVLANSGKPGSVVNYNAFALGREGAFVFVLVSPSSSIDTFKDNENTIIAALHYNGGKRYEDFVKGTDHVAAFGLAALITGLVAKKLGLLALAGVALAKIWKMLILFVVLFASKFKKLFKKGDQNSSSGNKK